MPARCLDHAVTLIKTWEGLKDGDPSTPGLEPYLCPAGYWTIGWGHVVRDEKGRPIQGAGFKEEAFDLFPKGITVSQAEEILEHDLANFSQGVELLVKNPVPDTKFCALTSLAFNIGLGAFGKSTVLARVNNLAYESVPSAFRMWVKVNGKVSSGLLRRREDEIRVWNL